VCVCVCGLAWRCCIRRWVKKRSSSAATLMRVFMADVVWSDNSMRWEGRQLPRSARLDPTLRKCPESWIRSGLC
jgi:hypothetical protein